MFTNLMLQDLMYPNEKMEKLATNEAAPICLSNSIQLLLMQQLQLTWWEIWSCFNKWTRNACSQELHYHLQSTQREGPYYLCPQPSHQQSTKKHFLVCKEHQELDENQKLLEKYIQNFMKSSNLPNFARSLSLTTQLKMTPQQKSHKIGNLQCTNSKGIYLLQRINVENGTFDILWQ